MDVEQLSHRLDAFQQNRRPLAFLVGVLRHTIDDRGAQLAALLAYYGFLSLIPLIVVLVTVLRVVIAGDPALQQRVLDTALAQIPVVGDDLGQVTTPDASGWILAVGTLIALWAGLGVLDTMQDIVQQVWEIPRVQQRGFLSRKLRSLALLVVLAVALGAVMAIGLAGTVVDLPVIARILTAMLTFVLASSVALVAFAVVGVGGPPWRDHLPGAVIIGAGWVVLQVVGTWLVTTRVSTASNSYGTFAVVIGLLAWLSILAWLVVLAAEVNVVRSKRLWPVSLLTPTR